MNTKNTTPPQVERFSYKVLFSVYGHESLIKELSSMGVVVKVDPTYKKACACFDNTIDFNDFKEQLKD